MPSQAMSSQALASQALASQALASDGEASASEVSALDASALHVGLGSPELAGVPELHTWDAIVGSRVGLRDTVARARLLAGVDVTVLLEGETGVGKEIFARAIHESGPRRGAPFVALNCGGLSRDLLVSELFGHVEGSFPGSRSSSTGYPGSAICPGSTMSHGMAAGGAMGRIESAQGGTLFLDEIGEMPLDLQPYLLRVLEGGDVYPVGAQRPRQVKFRLISACNRALRQQVNAGRFRMDLFYRISVTTLEVPPLRQRMEDLPALVEHFAAEVAARHRLPKKSFSTEAITVLSQYSWPGNVRELRNLIESMLLLSPGEVIDVDAIPADVRGLEGPEDFTKTGIRPMLRPDLEAVEREAIGAAIRARRGNLTQVARDLRISRSTLYLKLKKHRLDLL
ncbi:MAG TPA: sigma-54 dependent transcriptional regulator, partial [Polyangiaceae bacterium]|nr:sigma-54 dependent transcriptional regulator [Polyangiaceae bacterium]